MIGKIFLTAGKATFTVSNPRGERYTFRVSKPKKDFKGEFFASILTGTDNDNDYSYMAMMHGDRMTLRFTTKSNYDKHHLESKVLEFALNVLSGRKDPNTMPEGYAIDHAGMCGRCGRLLTVPESIVSGIGPECASKLGIDQKAVTKAKRASKKAKKDAPAEEQGQFPLGGPSFEEPADDRTQASLFPAEANPSDGPDSVDRAERALGVQ